MILIRPGCAKCESLLEGQAAKDSRTCDTGDVPIAYVDVTHSTDIARMEYVTESFTGRSLHTRLSRGIDWLVATPLEFRVRDGIVVSMCRL